MAMLDEQLVEEWLNRKGYFTMRGVKCGIGEIDLLAIKSENGKAECLHVEVQVSYRPIGYIGGNSNAGKRTPEEIEAGIHQWVRKKFKSKEKTNKRELIMPNANWKFWFVCAELKDEEELTLMKNQNIEIHRYKKVLTELHKDSKHQSSSTANNILEILRYIHPDPIES